MPSLADVMRLFRRQQQETASAELRLMTVGVWRKQGAWIICPADADGKSATVKLVTLPSSVVLRYAKVFEQWDAVQRELEAAPKSLRPRRKSARKVKIPE